MFIFSILERLEIIYFTTVNTKKISNCETKLKQEKKMASDSDDEFNDDTLWETELEIALLTKCDYGTIRSISKLRPIPDSLRSKVWKV